MEKEKKTTSPTGSSKNLLLFYHSWFFFYIFSEISKVDLNILSDRNFPMYSLQRVVKGFDDEILNLKRLVRHEVYLSVTSC